MDNVETIGTVQWMVLLAIAIVISYITIRLVVDMLRLDRFRRNLQSGDGVRLYLGGGEHSGGTIVKILGRGEVYISGPNGLEVVSILKIYPKS